MTAVLTCPPRQAARDIARAARRVRLPRTTRFTPDALIAWRARDLPHAIAHVTPEHALTWADLDRHLELVPALAAARRGAGLIVRTAGTTGPARPICRTIAPGGLLQLAGLVGRLPLDGVRTVACLAPTQHGHGLGTLLAAAALGVTFLDLSGASPDEAASLLARHRPELLTGVPLQLDRLAAALGSGPVPVPAVVSGSDLLRPATAQRVTEAFGARLWNCYGLTETGTVAVAGPDDLRRHPGTVGRPLPGVRLAALPDGRLEVSAPLAAQPIAVDRGHVTHGMAFVTGRADGQVVSGGELVDPTALTAALRALPGVRRVELSEVIVDGLHRFDATLTADGGEGLEPDAIRKDLRARLGPAHVPRSVTVIGD